MNYYARCVAATRIGCDLQVVRPLPGTRHSRCLLVPGCWDEKRSPDGRNRCRRLVGVPVFTAARLVSCSIVALACFEKSSTIGFPRLSHGRRGCMACVASASACGARKWLGEHVSGSEAQVSFGWGFGANARDIWCSLSGAKAEHTEAGRGAFACMG